jgi:hypothetical protein
MRVFVEFRLLETTIPRTCHAKGDTEETMRYLCLVYQEEEEGGRVARRCDADAGETAEYLEELRQRGQLIASSLWQPARSPTIRVRQGAVTITNGHELGSATEERLAGFCLIEARDLNDAIRVAAKLPAARLGSIEVRPLEDGSEA